MDQYQRIRYLYTIEKLSQRAIARQLGVSRNTVANYCDSTNLPQPKPRNRKSIVMTSAVVKAILGFLQEEAAAQTGAPQLKYTAQYIYDQLRESEALAFTGSYESVARIVRQLRQG